VCYQTEPFFLVVRLGVDDVWSVRSRFQGQVAVSINITPTITRAQACLPHAIKEFISQLKEAAASRTDHEWKRECRMLLDYRPATLSSSVDIFVGKPDWGPALHSTVVETPTPFSNSSYDFVVDGHRCPRRIVRESSPTTFQRRCNSRKIEKRARIRLAH
jgi:hypothetical protein